MFIEPIKRQNTTHRNLKSATAILALVVGAATAFSPLGKKASPAVKAVSLFSLDTIPGALAPTGA
jgi:hypothetical protein